MKKVQNKKIFLVKNICFLGKNNESNSGLRKLIIRKMIKILLFLCLFVSSPFSIAFSFHLFSSCQEPNPKFPKIFTIGKLNFYWQKIDDIFVIF